MTHNQIDYWKHQETSRHNLADEKETNRHNVVTETETGRHNRATEGIDLGKLQETTRHNLATEGISMSQLNELQRHNLAGERIDLGNLNFAYSNLDEISRHNAQQEGIGWMNAASTARINEANAAFRDLEASWYNDKSNLERLLGMSDYAKTQAQIEQLRSQVNNLNANTSRTNQEQSYRLADTIINGVGKLTGIISAAK